MIRSRCPHRSNFVWFFIFLLCGCTTLYNPATQKEEFIFINDTTEAAFGRNVALEIEKKYEVLSDTKDSRRVRTIGGRIAAVSDRQGLEYKFFVLEEKTLNALSLPGGIIYIHKGLLDILTDDELAFVLGHEVAHVAARHAVKKIQADMGFQLILTVALAAGGDADIARNLGGVSLRIYDLIGRGYSRQDEYQADSLGVKYAFRAGFNPRASISALEKIKKNEGPNWKLLEYLRTHPFVDDRIGNLNEVIPGLK